MLLENFIVCNVIFRCQAIFSTLYTGKWSGSIRAWQMSAKTEKVGGPRINRTNMISGLSHPARLKMYPGYLLEIG